MLPETSSGPTCILTRKAGPVKASLLAQGVNKLASLHANQTCQQVGMSTNGTRHDVTSRRQPLDGMTSPGPRVDVGQAFTGDYLTECSPRDKPWDDHRGQTDDVSAMFATDPELWKLAGRVAGCSPVLGFAFRPDRTDPDTQTLKLQEARFCHVRLCPVCQWRRTLMWIARFLTALPKIMESRPGHRFLFLTLTRRNVPIAELRKTLKAMSKAWHLVEKRRCFEIVSGWVRTTEVTRSEDGTAHPHYHCLLMVPPSYFKGGNYLSQAEWTRIWRESLKADYDPIVDIRTVKGDVLEAARETFKYSVKGSDMTADPEWFLELHRQVVKLRFIASGGVLKEFLREGEETDEDLTLFDESEASVSDDKERLYFNWRKRERRYKLGGH